MWKIIEPNASIIAACLPTYGTYIKGSRPLESVIRSVRSVISLKSLRNNTRGSKDSGARNQDKSSQGLQLSNDSLEMESQFSKKPGQNHMDTLIASGSQGKLSHDTEAGLLPEGNEHGIKITSGVTVTRT